MKQTFKLDNIEALVIPDIHHDIAWAKWIMNYEKGRYDKVIFGGDFFDSFRRPPFVATPKETAQFFKECANDSHCIMIAGNHDAAYWEVHGASQRKVPSINPCTGYSWRNACIINDILTQEDYLAMQMFIRVNGWLISHAGFSKDFRIGPWDNEGRLQALAIASVAAWNLPNEKSMFFNVSKARGGFDGFSGPLWLDFKREFNDDFGMKQLVFHTYSGSYHYMKKGESYCCDGGQTTYAMIHKDGAIEFKSAMRYEDSYIPYSAKEAVIYP